MERKGGCLLVPRYGAAAAGSGVAGQAPGMSWQMGRIMLKYRPIAPKPAAMAPAPAPTPAPVAAPAAAGAGRGKRKAAGGPGSGRRGRKPRKAATVAPVPAAAAPHVTAAPAVGEKESEKEKSLSSRSSSSSAMTSVDSSAPSPPPASQPATLPLMPVPVSDEKSEELAPVGTPAPAAGAQPVAPQPTLPAASCWVTVEDVTSTWRDGEAPSAAAAAAACGADGDAPAFVSDQWGRVTWANAAFTRAVSDGTSHGEAAGVQLAGVLPAWGACAGFTCRVRVRYPSPRRVGSGGGGSVVAPCDVWRLDAHGCYLWRLDLQAALTLGGLP